MSFEAQINPGLWTYEQVAIYLGTAQGDAISIRSVMRLCQQGKLRRIYPTPRKPRIDPQSVHLYVDSLKSQQYDRAAQGGGRLIGVRSWQKSTPARTPPTVDAIPRTRWPRS